MRKLWKFLVILTLCTLSSIILIYYFINKITYSLNPDELSIFRISTIAVLNILFCSLIFLLNIDYYKKVLTYLVIILVIIWFSVLYFNISSLSRRFWDYWEIVIFITFSMIAPGITVYIIHYIKKSTKRFEESKVFGVYHLHEGFIGILFIIIAVFLLWMGSKLKYLEQPYYSRYNLFLLIVQVLSFAFLYLGGFFFFRDWDDIVKLNFIENKKGVEKIKKNQSKVFNHIDQDDLHFFEFPKLVIYPIGIILTILSLNAITYGNRFYPTKIFELNNEAVIYIGYVVSFIAAGITGRDWLRIFRRFYPEAYKEIEQMINEIKDNTKY